MGQPLSGTSQLAQGIGGVTAPGNWHPTILYLFVFIIAEMFVFGLIGRILK